VSATVPTAEEFAALVARVEALEAKLAATFSPWPEWMNAETLARYIDTTVPAVHKLAARGQLPVHQEAPGCRLTFKRSEIDAHLASQGRTP
jgi:hypothetical protein